MLARWLTVLDTYDFSVEHRKGCLHGNADTLSRLPFRNRRCKCESCTDCNNGSSKGNILPRTLAPDPCVSTPCCQDDCSDDGPELYALKHCDSQYKRMVGGFDTVSSSQKGILMPKAFSGKARSDDVHCSSIQSFDDSIHHCNLNEMDESTVLCSNLIENWSQEQLEEMQSSDPDIKTLIQFKSVLCEKTSTSAINEYSQNVRILCGVYGKALQ
ncbi:hypothetical protein DPMN_148241 [Dreissena polymorpha]|uniref:Uncharacterized protein n=1 Tax=Dreissena polymorpha TaxID=45954 RepID=A0A9D4J3S5_DREPO|nr:hypothetical protein DPMN_148241 [Dreissena polymorpha]